MQEKTKTDQTLASLFCASEPAFKWMPRSAPFTCRVPGVASRSNAGTSVINRHSVKTPVFPADCRPILLRHPQQTPLLFVGHLPNPPSTKEVPFRPKNKTLIPKNKNIELSKLLPMLLPIQTPFIESRVGIPKTASRKQPISHVQFAEKVGQSRKVYPAFKAGPLNNTKPLINPGPVQLGEKKQQQQKTDMPFPFLAQSWPARKCLARSRLMHRQATSLEGGGMGLIMLPHCSMCVQPKKLDTPQLRLSDGKGPKHTRRAPHLQMRFPFRRDPRSPPAPVRRPWALQWWALGPGSGPSGSSGGSMAPGGGSKSVLVFLLPRWL